MRSSPGPKTGCSVRVGCPDERDRLVAILTRSEDRVQQVVGDHASQRLAVAILTRSEDRVQREEAGRERARGGVAILTRSEDRVQLGLDRGVDISIIQVAILTRSEDRVQLAFARSSRSSSPPVAILTRSEDRVQPVNRVSEVRSHTSLRSSPGPKTGCSITTPAHSPTSPTLRSSPGPKTGCSPTLRPGRVGRGELRSSPGPKTGCSRHRGEWLHPGRRVAILTRSEDRVQRFTSWSNTLARFCCDPHPVRRPGAASAALIPCACPRSCDPHPVRRPGAAPPPPAPPDGVTVRCDPHPVRRPGAAQRLGDVVRREHGVAILTRSEDRVQR